jgi:hypothetical protein
MFQTSEKYAVIELLGTTTPCRRKMSTSMFHTSSCVLILS